jgi:hypothetical protein
MVVLEMHARTRRYGKRTAVDALTLAVCRASSAYEVDALRTLMLAGGSSTFGLGTDFAVLVAATAGFVILGARVYPTVVR